MKINLSTTKEIFNSVINQNKVTGKYHKLDAKTLESKETIVTQEQWLKACIQMINPFYN